MPKEKLKNRFAIYARRLFIVVFIPLAIIAVFLTGVVIAQTALTVVSNFVTKIKLNNER